MGKGFLFLFRGDSMIYNAKGKKLADAGKREEITRTCTLKKSELDEFRLSSRRGRMRMDLVLTSNRLIPSYYGKT